MTGPIQYDEMGLISLGLQNGNRFGADFQRFATAIDMVIVISRFDEWAGQQRIMAMPGAWGVGWEDGGPARIIAVQLDRLGGQEEVLGEGRSAQQQSLL